MDGQYLSKKGVKKMKTEIRLKNGEVVKLKKDTLSSADVKYLVDKSLEVFIDDEDKDIKDYDFNPVSMRLTFNQILFSLLIVDYKTSDLEVYDTYYSKGVHSAILEAIPNAKEAYDIMIETASKMSSIEGVISRGIKDIMTLIEEIIPDKETINKALEKLPKQWDTVSSEYNTIMRK